MPGVAGEVAPRHLEVRDPGAIGGHRLMLADPQSVGTEEGRELLEPLGRPAARQFTPEENNAIAVRFFDSVWNKGDFSVLDTLIASDAEQSLAVTVTE